MRKLDFSKMVASGNDFVVLQDSRQSSAISYRSLAKRICDRKYAAGADGLLVLEKSRSADVKMRIFNSDGSEAGMCGNGARCVALFESAIRNTHNARLKIETKAGIIEAIVNGNKVSIKLTQPKDIKLNLAVKVNNRTLRADFINTGVPHAVIFVEGLEKIDVVNLGRVVRFHRRFAPAGANADFVEVLGDNSIALRTYERGVEDETLACGTGAAASALLYAMRYALHAKQINVHTKSAEILKVYFERTEKRFRDVWLEGKAGIVYKGVYYV